LVGDDARRSAAARGSQKAPSRWAPEEAASSMVALTRHSGSETRRASRFPSVPEAAAAAAVLIPRHKRRRTAAIAIDCWRWKLETGLMDVVLSRPSKFFVRRPPRTLEEPILGF
jgi:hypothetical protein